MMKRLFMLLSLALMIGAAMALSGVAQAKSNSASPDAKCAKQASAKLGKGFDPSGYTFVGGTAGDDNFDGKATTGPDVFCGFDGANSIYTLDAGDIFLGGAGVDSVYTNYGTFYGGDGNDSVSGNQEGSTIYGGADDDYVYNNAGIFYGGDGNDYLEYSFAVGTFYGDAGDDYLDYNTGTFDGGAGTDTFGTNDGGTLVNVP